MTASEPDRKVSNADKGILARRRILDHLKAHPEGATQIELCRVTGLTLSTVHAHVQKLAQAGMLIHRRHKRRVFYNGADSLQKALLLVESCIGVFDQATRWADAYVGVDKLREAAEVMRMVISKEQQDGRDQTA